ncbi:EF-hand domain-containing protein [Brevundimonas sp. CEF1]|uniref:EF-hand domain-containing protein n=1 Tax=Brevundimonas sp. CEF1 TaxID=3442642 RepID=UPI003F512E70
MKKTISGVAAIAFLTAFSGVAVAQTAAPQRPARATMAQPVSQADFVARRVERLRAADANRDGTVTAEELRAAGQAKRAERRTAMFERLDANKDGSISRAEFDAPRAEGQRDGQRAGRGAHAGRGHRGGMHGGAQRMGRNGEGRTPIVITEAEQKASEAFARLDANRDGTLTLEERRAGMEARRAEMREKRQERRQAAPAASPSTPASE